MSKTQTLPLKTNHDGSVNLSTVLPWKKQIAYVNSGFDCDWVHKLFKELWYNKNL